jgi:hypothetical protein
MIPRIKLTAAAFMDEKIPDIVNCLKIENNSCELFCDFQIALAWINNKNRINDKVSDNN